MKKLLFMMMLSLLTGLAFAQSSKDPYLYGTFPPEEADQHLTDFLPVYFNGQGFLEPETKYELGQVAQSRLVREDGYPYRDYFNAAVIYATPIGGVRHYGELTDTDAANAIRYATRAIKESPRMPYMYLVRAETYHRQGVPFREVGIAPVLDRDMALKAMEDYEMLLELNPKMAPMTRICTLAESLKDKARMGRYCREEADAEKITKEEIVKKLLERQKVAQGKKLPIVKPDAKPISLPLDKKLVPVGGKKAPVARDLFRGVPRRAN